MKLVILEEHGYASALLGLSLSHNQDPERMPAVGDRLKFLGDGHNKFLESVVVWMDMTAPRYFWQQFDTYRIGVSKQSESTMHTLTARPLAQEDFAHSIPEGALAFLNERIEEEDWETVKWNLPESFLQRRIICTNYMALQRIVRQRRSHRLPEWQDFVSLLCGQIEHPELISQEARS